MKKSWIGLVTCWRGSAAPVVLPRVLTVVLVASVATYLHETTQILKTSLTPMPFSLVGLALGIFLGFRNNTSYDRFWEGRKLWGRVVNTARSLTRQTLTLMAGSEKGSPSELQKTLVRVIVAYTHSLRLHLRDDADNSLLERHLPAGVYARLDSESNRPIAILQHLGDGGLAPRRDRQPASDSI